MKAGFLDVSAAVAVCRDHGLRVEAPGYGPVELPGEFCKRIGLDIRSLHRTMTRLPDGIPVIIKRGARRLLPGGRRRSAQGRIISIRSSVALEEWIAKRKLQSGYGTSR